MFNVKLDIFDTWQWSPGSGWCSPATGYIHCSPPGTSSVSLGITGVHIQDDEVVVGSDGVLGAVEETVVIRLPGHAGAGLAGDVGELEYGSVASQHSQGGRARGGGYICKEPRSSLILLARRENPPRPTQIIHYKLVLTFLLAVSKHLLELNLAQQN